MKDSIYSTSGPSVTPQAGRVGSRFRGRFLLRPVLGGKPLAFDVAKDVKKDAKTPDPSAC